MEPSPPSDMFRDGKQKRALLKKGQDRAGHGSPMAKEMGGRAQFVAREDTLPNGISWVSSAVNHCLAHGTWNPR
jgi:hypothetical protein